jgi:cation diffusion facilitator family transporter
MPNAHPLPVNRTASLTRYAWLSIAAAVVTIALKFGAYLLTGSVGLMSDALESLVNLVAAIGALIALIVAEREPNEEFAYGFAKAEYFSSGLEGALIFLAAAGIVVSAVPRFIDPQPISAVGWGLAVSSLASLVNLVVGWRLLRAGYTYQSITLEADARHLLTDVLTSIGVILGVGLVAITGWYRFDAIVAMLVAVNILWTGFMLIRRSTFGLLDRALPAHERAAIEQVLARYVETEGAQWHALLTRQAGRRRFVSVHILVPGDCTVHRGHQLLEQIEGDIRTMFPFTTVFTHLESLDDPASYEDTTLDRVARP